MHSKATPYEDGGGRKKGKAVFLWQEQAELSGGTAGAGAPPPPPLKKKKNKIQARTKGIFRDWLSKRNSWVKSNPSPRIVYGHLLLQIHIHHCRRDSRPPPLWKKCSNKESTGRPLVWFCVVTVSSQVSAQFKRAKKWEESPFMFLFLFVFFFFFFAS